VLAKVAIFVNQLRHLLLQPIILLHEKLVHGCELPIYSLQPKSFNVGPVGIQYIGYLKDE